MAKRYRMTARRRAALRKAQLASARKRKLSPRAKKAVIAGGVAAGVLGAGVARHKLSGSKLSVNGRRIVVKGESVKSVNVNGRKIKTIVKDPNGSRVLGPKGFYGSRTKKGFQVGLTVRTKNRDTNILYHHDGLKVGVLGTKIDNHLLSQKNRKGMAYRQLKFKTRAIRGAGNPYAPTYRPKTNFGYGAYGKRMPRVDQFVKTRGKKKVSV